MSGAKFSNRDLTSCSICASSTFALRNWVILAFELPSLYRVAAVDVSDMPLLHISIQVNENYVVIELYEEAIPYYCADNAMNFDSTLNYLFRD
jgi:hypothetical protein